MFCIMISFPSLAFSNSLRLASARAAATSAWSLAISVSYLRRVSFEASHDVTGADSMPITAKSNSVLIVSLR